MRLKAVALAATIMSGVGAANAFAQTQSSEATPAAETASPDNDEGDQTSSDDIVVTGELPEISSDIDARVYSLRDDPQAQTAPILDVLGRVPSVSVTPSGQVLLLGNPRVTILIDGEPPSSPNALRLLPASRIDRIEVMTNPSARNTAEGTAGIINLITKQRTEVGLTGTLLSSLESDGGAMASFSPSITRGRFTFDGLLGYSSDRSRSRTFRRSEVIATGDETFEHQHLRGRLDQWDASASVTYEPNERQTWSATLEGSIADPWNGRSEERVTGSAAGFEPYAESTASEHPLTTWRISSDYQWRSRLAGESLRVSAYFDRSDWDTSTSIFTDFDNGALTDTRLLTSTQFDDDVTSFKLDYRRPFGEDIRLEAGGSWVRTDSLIETAQQTLSGIAPAPDFIREIEGDRSVLAGYVALQVASGDWTLKPGLRLEDQRFDILSGGLGADNDDFGAFPSLFVERRLSSAIKLNLSYSRRTSRPNLQQLDPAIVFSSTTSARYGNPDLAPETTDAFEARLSYQQAGRNLMLTIYDRETDDVFASLTERVGDIYFTTPVNAGETLSRGAEISWRSPINENWRYALTGNIFWREQDVFDGALTHRNESFTYSGSAQLDYSAGGNGNEDRDQFQFSVRFAGPRQLFQGESDGYVVADAVWRRPLNNRLSAVLSVSDIFESAGGETRLETADFIDETEVSDLGRVFKLALSYRLGGEDEE